MRARELDIKLEGTPGPYNAITDVAGVTVGYTTINGKTDDERPIRTGVTAILPRGLQIEPHPVFAGFSSLNGNGEFTGTQWIRHAGLFAGPIALTNTHSVGVAHSALTRWMLQRYDIFEAHRLWYLPVVAETYDGILNDINGLHVREAHVLEAIDNATSGAIAEGNVGGGNGMVCYGFKGGTGTASRQVRIHDRSYTTGVLVQANHGQREWLRIPGGDAAALPAPPRDSIASRERGSIVIVIATDAPLLPHQLSRLAKRAGLGIARNGTPGGNDSGDMFLAFSTANERPLPNVDSINQQADFLSDEILDTLYLAVVQAVEEAVLNAMLQARTVPAYASGKMCYALDADALARVLDGSG